MPNIDLTTLPGWSSLSTGSHNITIVARADGYRDSEPSESVMVTKESTVYNLTLPDITWRSDEVISPSGMTLYTSNNNANIIQVSEKTYNAVTQYNDDEVPSFIQQFASAYNVVLPDTIESLTEVGYRVTFADGTPIEEQPIELRSGTAQDLEAVTVLRLNWKTDELEVLDITVDNSDIGGKITINTGSDYLFVFCLKNEDPLAGTWVFNLLLNEDNLGSIIVNFTWNNKTFVKLNRDVSTSGFLVNEFNGDTSDGVNINFYSNGSWVSGYADRTITITSKLSEVTNGDALLTWLQANATKQ